MYPTNAYVIRDVTSEDLGALRRLVELDGRQWPSGPVLIGEVEGTPAAAVSLADGRIVAYPDRSTVVLRQLLEMRSRALRTYSRTRSLPERLRAALAPFRASTAAA